MVSAGRPHDLPDIVLKLARARASEVARRNIIPVYEREDIEQHLLLEFWRRRERFDGGRGGLPGFVVRVIDNAVADLIQRHGVHRRAAPPQFVSLPELVGDHEGDVATLGEGIPEDRALWPGPSTQLDAADLRIDLGRSMACLPSCLQDLCRRLSCQPIAQIARETGSSRSSIYASVATIRRCFLEAGLHCYLAEGPPLSITAP